MKRRQYKQRYGMIYFTVTNGGWSNPDRWGSTNNLERAHGWCAFHVSAGDVNRQEARKAAIVDRFRGAILKTFTRTANGITIKEH